MKKIFLLAAAVCAAFNVNALQVLQVDTIFTDDFSSLVENRYTFTSPGDKISVTDGSLKMSCPKNSTNAQNIAVADYGQETINLNAMEVDSIVWTFCMRNAYGKTTDVLSGFDSGKRGIATMLIADGADLTKANGYAVAMGGNSALQYRLVKVTGGLKGNSHLTDVIAGQINESAKYYQTFRIVYIPATNTWKMEEAHNSSAFVAPAAVETWTADGTDIDDTFVDTPLKYFGFYQNYAGKADFNVYFAHFTLATYKMVEEQPTALDNTQSEKHCIKTIENGQIIVIRDGVKYSVLGSAL